MRLAMMFMLLNKKPSVTARPECAHASDSSRVCKECSCNAKIQRPIREDQATTKINVSRGLNGDKSCGHHANKIRSQTLRIG